MRKITYFKTMLLAIILVVGSGSAWGQVVISQVYGGGGNSGATYTNDFIELYNRGTSPVSLNGWSVQYTSATGTTWTNQTNLPSITLNPGQYYLIQEASGGAVGSALPTADATGTINLSATAGKVALCNSTTALTAVSFTLSSPTGSSIVDFVGFASTATNYEGTSYAPAPSATKSIIRAAGGCTDTNVNSADFTSVTPNPRNSSTYQVVCSTPTTQSTGILFSSVSGTAMTLSWTAGNGTSRAVFMKEGTGTITNPVNGTLYTASTDWSSKGTQLGTSGYYCVYNGTGSSVTLSNLLSSTTYTFQVFEYYGSGVSSNYFTSTATNNPNTQVTSVGSLSPQSITFNSLSAVTYGDVPFTVSATGGGSGNPVTFTSSDVTVATCSGTNGTTVTILKAGSCTIYADQAGDGSYNPATQVGQTLTVNAIALTIPDAAVTSKIYNGTNAAVITGTLTGIINSDDVTLTGTGTFVDVNVADGIAVTSTSTLGGTKATNYSLTQPTGLTGNITKADQTITLAATATKSMGDVDYSPATSVTSGTNVITYASSHLDVATIVSGKIHLVSAGTTTITASQAASTNYNAAPDATQTLTVLTLPIVAWNPNGLASYGPSPWTPTTVDPNLTIVGLTRGSGIGTGGTAAGSAWGGVMGAATTTATGAITNSQYVTFSVTPNTNYAYSLSSFDLSYRRSNTGAASGLLQYAIGAGAYNDITTLDFSNTTSSGAAITQVDLSSTPAFQNVPGTINFRIVLYNNTGSGTWYVYNSGIAIHGGIATHDYLTIATGSDNWSSVSEWVDNALPPTGANVQVKNTLVLDQNVTISALTIDPSAILNINAGKQLTVSTTMTNNGTLNLLSTAADGTATILTPAAITGSGTYNVQQYLTGGTGPTDRQWWYVSSPVKGANAKSGIFTPSGVNNFGYYNESITDYVQIPGDAEPLLVGHGYVSQLKSTATYIFTGDTLNNGPVSVPVTRTGITAGKRGFNLIGNPYPSYLDWTKVDTTNVLSTIWYRSFKSATSEMIFDTYNGKTAVGINNSNTGNLLSNLIPPMQAFWVKVRSSLADVANLKVDFTNAMRSHRNIVTTGLLRAPKLQSQQILRLDVSNGTNSDQAVVVFNENASNSFDDYDSPKMSNNNVNIAEIFTFAGTEEVAINGLNSLTSDKELTLGFRPGKTSNFSIEASEISNLSSDTKVMLLDKLNGTEQELTVGSPYTFASDATATNDRFSLIFKTNSIATDLTKTANKGVLVYRNLNNHIAVICNQGIDDQSSVSIYNAVGQKLSTQKLTRTTTEINKVLNTGVYLVTVHNAGQTVTERVIIK